MSAGLEKMAQSSASSTTLEIMGGGAGSLHEGSRSVIKIPTACPDKTGQGGTSDANAGTEGVPEGPGGPPDDEGVGGPCEPTMAAKMAEISTPNL